MPRIEGRNIIYTADDEMPDCLQCDRCTSDFDCCEYCGAEHGWWGYKRTQYIPPVTDKIRTIKIHKAQ